MAVKGDRETNQNYVLYISKPLIPEHNTSYWLNVLRTILLLCYQDIGMPSVVCNLRFYTRFNLTISPDMHPHFANKMFSLNAFIVDS